MNDLAFTKITSNLEVDNRAMRVWLWDCGPAKPDAPKRPAVPKGREGEAEYDLAMIDFRQAIADYDEALKTYGQRKKEFAEFESRFGGPYLILFWSCDANDALSNDARAVKEGRQAQRRYYISSRTRGYEKLPNMGLPQNAKPGHGHAENMRREEEGDADMAFMRRSDPVFGQEQRK